MNQHVSLTFSLKYLVNFSKSASLAVRVQLMMSNDVPLLVMHRPVDRCVYSYEIHYRFPMILTRVLFVTILHPKSVMTDVLPSAVLCCLSACCSFFAQSTCHHLSQDCLFRRIPLQSFLFPSLWELVNAHLQRSVSLFLSLGLLSLEFWPWGMWK